MSTSGRARAVLFRTAAAAAALVAALGPEATGAPRRRTRVLLVDQSESCARRPATDTELAAASAGLGSADRLAVVAFGERAVVVAGPVAPAGLRPGSLAVPPWGTSLAAALGAAADLVRPEDRAEFLVATDGRVTDTDRSLTEAVEAVRRIGGADLRVLARIAATDASAVHVLRGPGRAAVGEVVVLEATGVAGANGALVELLGDGGLLERRRVDRAGPFRVAFARTADRPGMATWTARTPETAGAPLATARVVVSAPGSTLVASRGPLRPELAAAVGGAPSAIDLTEGGGALADLLAGQDALVLDDLPADDVAPAAAAIERFVRGGGGLLVLGGERSWAAGDWTSAASLERRLPLRAEPPDEEGRVVYLALDGSGSMGEPWPGAASRAPRDLAVGAAARRLVRSAPPGTQLLVRRFREEPVPAGSAPLAIDLAAEDRSDPAADQRRTRAERAISGLPPPGGSTAFAPILREALDLVAARPERVKVVLLLTDGRSAEDPAALGVLVGRLSEAGVRTAVVVPGRVAAAAPDAALLRAAVEAGVPVLGADAPELLPEALLTAERRARGVDPFVADRELEVTDDAAPLLGGAAPVEAPWPRHARRMNRTWRARDAVVVARTTDLVPLAAIRTEPGGGRVAALAARVGGVATEAWLDGDGGTTLVRSLLGGVRRRAAATLRVEIEGERLLASIEPRTGPGAVRATAVRWFAGDAPRGTSPLRPEGDGLLSADLPVAGDADRASFLDAEGREIVSAGLDRSATPELRVADALDFEALAHRLRPLDEPPATPLRPWFAASAVVLLVLGSVKSRPVAAR